MNYFSENANETNWIIIIIIIIIMIIIIIIIIIIVEVAYVFSLVQINVIPIKICHINNYETDSENYEG